MSALTQESRAIGLMALRALSTVAIAYLFMVVLMNAATQSSIANALDRSASKYEYSAGYAAWDRYRARAAEIRDTRQRAAVLAVSVRRLEAEMKLAEDAAYDQLSALGVLVETLGPENACRVAPDRQIKFYDVIRTINILQICQASAALPAPQRPLVSRYLDNASGDLRAAVEAWFKAYRRHEAAAEQLKAVRENVAALAAEQQDDQAVAQSFSELDALANNWLVWGTTLARLPPAINQILLAFTAGMFGALLLTLVLIVYPKSDLRLTSTGESYGARVLLGGLISVCVFVVIGGGTTVLGTGSAFAEGEVNYLAFCAIGILAGMFSDRVAFWLSTRADSFFVKAGEQPPP